MANCPHCQTENRSGAKFCRNCAQPLPETGNKPKPTTGAVTLRLDQTIDHTHPMPVSEKRTDTQPLVVSPKLAHRPEGAIFGDAFLYSSLIFDNEFQNQYLVSPLRVSEEHVVRVCPQPDCGAFFPPRQEGNGYVNERFCTSCGAELLPNNQDVLLFETNSPFPASVLQIVAKGLSHRSVRAPLFAFEEHLAGGLRYCLVMPHYATLHGGAEASQTLQWGVDLAHGLDYLHDNGVGFDGHLSDECFGLAGRQVVWANLSSAVIHPDGFIADRSQDAAALAHLVFYWLTGKSKIGHDPSLAPPIQQFFDQVAHKGFNNSGELADTLEQAILDVSNQQTVDYHTGRRTHVGMQRTLNEDSLLSIEITRNQQSVSQPLGIYVVADGMGGHAAGEKASGAIVNTIAERAIRDLLHSQISEGNHQDCGEWLRRAVEEANKAVFELRKSVGADMGSTLVAAVLEKNTAHVAHAGDSRAYLINLQGIRQLTTDHSLVERLIATNQITREEARHHPQRNVIYRTIGDKAKLDVELATHKLVVGDFLLLCSDGLSGMVEDKMIYQIVTAAPSPQAACDELISAANAAGGDDNITAILVKIIES
jgi:protein phosphatase